MKFRGNDRDLLQATGRQRLRKLSRRRRRTTATFYSRRDGALLGYKVSGHTGYAEAGADIVCAAVSALTQTTLNGLKHVINVPVMFEQRDARAFLEVRLTPEVTETQLQEAQILLRTLLEGLQAIERNYPHNLRIIKGKRR